MWILAPGDLISQVTVLCQAHCRRGWVYYLGWQSMFGCCALQGLHGKQFALRFGCPWLPDVSSTQYPGQESSASHSSALFPSSQGDGEGVRRCDEWEPEGNSVFCLASFVHSVCLWGFSCVLCPGCPLLTLSSKHCCLSGEELKCAAVLCRCTLSHLIPLLCYAFSFESQCSGPGTCSCCEGVSLLEMS